MLLFLAGLQQIPGDMYEAAALDNASRWRTFWRITIPSLRRTIVLVVMLQTAAQLQIFGQAQLLTAGGPSGASRTAVLFLFETAFGRWELGYASAAAEILFLIILAVTLAQYWATGRTTGAQGGR
jgi:multiple sugar transport system permease protein